MQIYIDKLPESTCWRKYNTAIVGSTEDVPTSGLVRGYFVKPEDIASHNLPHWLRGCNSMGRPHPTGAKILAEKGLIHLMQNISIPVLSVEQLLEKFGVCRIGRFKVDVEGFDGALLVGYSKWMKKHKGRCYADIISGEFNELSDGLVGGKDADAAMAPMGYRISSYGTKSHPDWEWSYNPDLIPTQ